MTADLLRARDIAFRYGDTRVLANMSFAIREGEFVSVLGPSGCGKTTLLNLVAGFLFPTSGELLFDGRPISGPGPDRAVVFQKGALFEWMTVRDNVEFSLRCRGVALAQRRQVGEAMLRLVGLEGFAQQYPYNLSGGMQQRVGVARVLAARPRIMLMDEPFAAVDVQTRESLQEELLRLHHETRCTVVFITHSIEEAVFLSDRILVLSRRPGGLRFDLPVDLPAPRWEAGNRLHPRFIELREQIYLSFLEDRRAAAAVGEQA